GAGNVIGTKRELAATSLAATRATASTLSMKISASMGVTPYLSHTLTPAALARFKRRLPPTLDGASIAPKLQTTHIALYAKQGHRNDGRASGDECPLQPRGPTRASRAKA